MTKDNGAVTHVVYDEAGRLLGEYDGTGATRKEVIRLNGVPVAVFAGGAVSYVHSDQLGTPRLITDGTGTVRWRWDSAPFGDTAADGDPDGDGSYAEFNLRFPGQYYDSETGLHYNYYRDYIPGFGRYVESDPIGLAGGLNTYGYVAGNLLSAVDPLGLIEWHGTYVQYTAGFSLVGSIYTFVLYSECVDGRRANVRVRGKGVGGSLSIPIGATGGEIRLRDPWDDIWVPGLAGPFAAATSGAVVGGGVGAGSITVGDAQSLDLISLTAGADANALTGVVGFSNIVPGSVYYQKCEESCDSE